MSENAFEVFELSSESAPIEDVETISIDIGVSISAIVYRRRPFDHPRNHVLVWCYGGDALLHLHWNHAHYLGCWLNTNRNSDRSFATEIADGPYTLS